MDAALALLFLLVAGVNFGWQPAQNSTNGYEYIVQVEPELVDGLERGQSVPIESNVPPEVGPISKVRIVVGRGDVPRDTVSAVQRTAYFAGQASWTPDQYNPAPPSSAPASASTYDRYGQPGTTPPTGVSPPPSVINRAQTAVTDTSNAMREGVEAGIQAANQQFSTASNQVMGATRNASQEFSQQLQSFANDPVGQMRSANNSIGGATEQALGSASNQTQQVSNPFAAPPSQSATAPTQTRSNVAPPPWPSANSQNSPAAAASSFDQTAARGMTPTRTESGWTSIGTGVAAPPLIIPQSTPTNNFGPPVRMATGGPQFPASSWDTGSAVAPATIGGTTSPPPAQNTARDLVQIQPAPGQNGQPSQPATSTWDDPWARDPWGQTPPPQASVPAAQDLRNTPATTRDPAVSWQIGTGQPMLVPNQPNQTFSSGSHNGQGTVGSQTTPQSGTNQSPTGVTAEQPPWMPLLLVSLSLMGSLSANLFLGWSYLDARQKYRSLVRKTADTFRRVTNAAA